MEGVLWITMKLKDTADADADADAALRVDVR